MLDVHVASSEEEMCGAQLACTGIQVGLEEANDIFGAPAHFLPFDGC